MITRFTRKVYRRIRTHGKLSKEEAATAIGRDRQIIYRIEGKENQLLTPEQEDRLVKKANLSKEAFVEIMCIVLSKFLGRPVIIAPKGRYMPSSPLARAAALYSFYEERLPPALKVRVRSKLNACQMLETAADEVANQCEMDVLELIDGVVGPVAIEDLDLLAEDEDDAEGED